MENPSVDQDQQWLLNCLTATLDNNHEVRAFAEASLHQASVQPGFGCALSKVAVNQELPFGLRQLAAVLLKQFIKKHWQENEENFEHPVVHSEEKAIIRKLLLLGLDDPHAKICTAVGMTVASIANFDWPEDWPELMPILLKLISDRNHMSGVRGALRCLALFSDDLYESTVPTLVPVLFPCLHTIVSSPQIYDKALRTKALSLVYSCIFVLGVMSTLYKTETSSLMTVMVGSWMEQFALVLQPPVQSEEPEDWSIRMEVLKCLNQYVRNIPSHIEADLPVIVPHLWQTFVSSLNVYEMSSILGTGDPFLGRYDSEGAEQSLEAFVIQLFEFFMTLVGDFKLKVIESNIKDLAYYTIGFMQMTEQQVHTWSLDANQYVAAEGDNTYNTYSCRVSGAILLDEVVSSCGEGIDAIVEAAQLRFTESRQEKATGSAIWWRKREAVIFALASLSKPLIESQVSGSSRFSLGNLLELIITEDIGTGAHEYPFLRARAIAAVAKFSSVISQGVLEQFTFAAIDVIGLDVPPPVKVGACRALSQLLPEVKEGILQHHMMGLFSSLTNLLKHASDETLHLVLEALQAAIRAGHEAIVSIEPIISPLMVNTWASHVSDPFISINTVEILEAIKNSPGCMRPLVSRVLHSISSVLEKPQQQSDGLVAGSLDLLTMLLKNAPIDVVKAVYDVCFCPVIKIILHSDDDGERQNATECLAAFVYGGKQDMLAWGGDPGFTMKSLLDAASRLLDPDLKSSGSLFVGSYILNLILHMPSQMAQHIRELIAALIRRMQSSQLVGLRSSLLLIFARLVHVSAPNVEQFIDLLIALPAEGYDNSLAYVMSEWTKLQGEIQGSYQIKVTTTALALLLSTRHVELAKIHVQGHLIKTAGITTRSKAKVAPNQWTAMPLPAKILALLADMLIDIKEGVLAGDDEDDDLEEVQDEDGDIKEDVCSAGTTLSSRPRTKHLDAIAKVFNKNHDDSYDEEHLYGADPINEIDLANYMTDFLVKFSNSDRILFNNLLENLTNVQQNAIRSVLHR